MSGSRKRCVLPWIGVAVLVLLLIIALGERLISGMGHRIELDSAVHHTSDAAARMTAAWHTDGQWPPPGEVMNRGLTFISSEVQADGRRVDCYQGIPGPIDFILSDDGTMLVFLRREE